MNSNEVEILLVEDNPHDVEMTLEALQAHNLSNKVMVLKDGEEALDYMFATGKYSERNTNDKPKLILLDLKLPKINGLEVLKRLKSDPLTKLIPVVILTSSFEQRDVIEGYKLGVNSYIVKPVDFTKFSDAVSKIGLYWLLLNKPPMP